MLLKEDLPLLAIKTLGSADTIIYFVETISNAHSPLDSMHVPSETSISTEDTSIPATPATAELIREQAKDAYCRAMTS